MKKRTLLFSITGLLGLTLLGLTASVRAETWKARELRRSWEQAAWKFGPLRIQPLLIIRDAGYDSNIYYHPEAVSDFWLTAGPGADAYFMVKKRLLVHLFESPQYVYFFKTERERTWNNYLNGEVSLSFNRFLLTAGGALNRARERWNTEIDIRPRRNEKKGFLSLLYQRSYRVSFEVTATRIDYRYESIEYDSVNIGERLSRLETFWSGKFYYRLNPRLQFFLEGEWGRYDFQSPSSLGDSRSRALYSGFEFSPGGRVRGRLRLGHKFFDTLQEGRPDFRGLVGDTSISWTFFRPLVLRASYRRDVNFSVWSQNPFFVGNSWSAGSSLYLFRKRIRLDYTYSRLRNDYPLGEVPGSEPRQDDYTLNSMALYIRITKTAGFGISGGLWTRAINVLNWDAERRFLGLNLTYEF
ncbi:MAG: outer membrane beta-barrel protein [Candidatus Saccharicenans sp.]|nr:outer membrane beta-barrel protein [Candidatus Saccharicenans sp.]MDI6848210.1 outer membrane beta-barrel protein [Candidatus Saccharicenans sp.]